MEISDVALTAVVCMEIRWGRLHSTNTPPVPQLSVESILFCRLQVHVGFLHVIIFLLFDFCESFAFCTHNLAIQVSHHFLRFLKLIYNSMYHKPRRMLLELGFSSHNFEYREKWILNSSQYCICTLSSKWYTSWQ